MIKVNELRLGNWVNEKVLGDCRVVSIWELQASLNNGNDDADYAINAENLYPIPLTPEILLACGFVKDENDDYWIDLVTNYLKAMFMKDGCYPVWFCVAELSLEREQMASLNRINYLHQLQNLYFALTGEELTYSPELLKSTN